MNEKEFDESFQQLNESYSNEMTDKKLLKENREDDQASKDLMLMLEAEDVDCRNNEMTEEGERNEDVNNTHSLEVASLLDSYIEENSQHNDLDKDVDEFLNELSVNYSSHNDTHHNLPDNFINNMMATTSTSNSSNNIPSSMAETDDSFMDTLDRITDDLDDISDIITSSNYSNSSWPQLSTTSMSTSQMSGGKEKWPSINSGFNEVEAEVAVQSIMDTPNMHTNGEESLSSLDFTGLEEMDVQIDCAIKSIMMSSPNRMDNHGGSLMSSTSSISMHHHQEHLHHQQHHQHQSMYQHHQAYHSQSMRASMSYSSAPVNDPLLDEAVKSILG